MLVFEESVHLSEHSWKAHNTRLQVQFGFQGDSDEEEKKVKRIHVAQQRNFQQEDFEEQKGFGESRPYASTVKEAIVNKKEFPSLG